MLKSLYNSNQDNQINKKKKTYQNNNRQICKIKRKKKDLLILLISQFIFKRAMDKSYAMNVQAHKEMYRFIISYQVNVNLVSLITDIKAHMKIPRYERGL